MVDVVTYHSTNAKLHECWLGYCVLEGEQLYVRFSGNTEADVIAKAQAWYAGEAAHQRRLIGRQELEPTDTPAAPIKNQAVKDGWVRVAPVTPEKPTSGNVWGAALPSSGGENTLQAWTDVIVKNKPSFGHGGHGNAGKVWMVHHTKRHKVRVEASMIGQYEAEGYVKGGPRTQFA